MEAKHRSKCDAWERGLKRYLSPTWSFILSIDVEPSVKEVILLAVVAAQAGQDGGASGLISSSQLVGASLVQIILANKELTGA